MHANKKAFVFLPKMKDIFWGDKYEIIDNIFNKVYFEMI
jgi:hypothetical protein